MEVIAGLGARRGQKTDWTRFITKANKDPRIKKIPFGQRMKVISQLYREKKRTAYWVRSGSGHKKAPKRKRRTGYGYNV